MDSSLSLPTPDAFPIFPYDKPYDIQLDLMQHLYRAIEDKAVVVVESPTGTGKTASLLSATISWLLDDRERAKKGYLSHLATNDPNDWVAAQALDRRRRELETEEAEYRERHLRAQRREEAMKRIASGRVVKRQKLTHPDGKHVPNEDAFLPDDSTDQGLEDNVDPRVKALMQRLATRGTLETNAEEPTCTKVYFTSRTHSQLSQIIGELHRLRISTTAPQTSETDKHTPTVRVVSLGSRKQLCINKPLIDSGGDLDEKCRELLTGKAGSGCGFFPPRENETQLLEFRDQILAIPKDIEDLATSGKLSSICPYFGSRKAIKQAQLVALPYNLLLSGVARKALGIDVTDQIIVIDEAHNLISTLLSLSSVVLDVSVIRVSVSQLDAYLSKFRLRLSHDHLLRLQKLRVSLNAIQQFAVEWKKARSGQGAPNSRVTEVMSVGELVAKMGKNIEGINLLDIRSYLENSRIARKISSYSNDKTKKGATPPLHTVEAFLLALASPSDDGRIILTAEVSKDRVEIKYQQLNPASHFRELVEASRCVILAGGTMSPIPAMTNQLFPDVDINRIRAFSCGHIVPPSNVLAVVVQKGPRGGQMEFKFQNREDQTLFGELGQLLLNLVNVVPAGMVVFFSSYRILDGVRRLWTADKTLDKIGLRKKVFYEPTETAEVENVLRDYGKEIQQSRGPGKSNGALLMAVVGAKLSEGLNFTDGLARAVVMVGLPYPNASSPELKERLEYVSNLSKQKGETGDAGKELYENLCMNAVNQSIGRAIRHQGDWASLVLVDTRYSLPRIQDKLPSWISSDVKVTGTFGATMKTLGEYYKGKR